MQVLLTKEYKSFKTRINGFLNDYLKENNSIDLKHLWQSLYKNSIINKSDGFSENILLTIEICRRNPGIGLFLLTQFTCIEIIKTCTSKSLKERYLDKLISGENIACFSLTEPQAGSDIRNIETTAKKENDTWILNGHKIWASNGSLSDIIITFAQAKSHGDKTGITCFLIPSKEIEISIDTPKLGVRITPSNELFIKNLRIPASNMIGNIGDGIKIALGAITLGRLFCAAQAIGLLEGILYESIKHSTKRNQFGKSISENQAIKWYIADMTKDLEAGRLLLQKACWMQENNSSELNKYSSMAKYFCTSTAQKHSTIAVQIQGGKGLTDDSYVSMAYRDSKVLEIYEGTNEIQKLILAKELL